MNRASHVTPLKLAIVASGIPQKQIAHQIGLDPAQLSRIVNGLHANDATRRKIARVLGRTEAELWPPEHLAA